MIAPFMRSGGKVYMRLTAGGMTRQLLWGDVTSGSWQHVVRDGGQLHLR